jgi:phosphopantothenoylcysteine decarboxylase/phosphopantothenate--cysteine ligase
MLEATESLRESCDIFIATAAVADYRPAVTAEQKIKKSGEELQIQMVRNPDILATMSAGDPRPMCIGFAAETRDIEQYALGKLRDKGLDLIIANDVSAPDIGFNSDDNAATVYWRGGNEVIERTSKLNLARRVVTLIARIQGNNQK